MEIKVMQSRRIFAVTAVVLAIMHPLGLAPVGEALAAPATVDIKLTIEPYAEVTLDSDTVTVTLPADGGSSVPVYVGGTVTANCSVMLFVDIEPPVAVGDWYATLMVPDVDQPGVHVFGQLVRIVVRNIPAGHGGGVELGVIGSKLGDSPTAQAGQVVITVMQM